MHPLLAGPVHPPQGAGLAGPDLQDQVQHVCLGAQGQGPVATEAV